MRIILAGALLAASLAVQGCSKQDGGTEAATASKSGETDLAKALDDKSDMSTLAGALDKTGLDSIFANAGSYTLIAPTNAAFSKLGDKVKVLQEADDTAALTAIVRAHLVPGYLTRDDISKAIDANAGKPVKMATLGTTELTFEKDGNAIAVIADDGSRGRLAGDAVPAGPSVALPIDTVLKKL